MFTKNYPCALVCLAVSVLFTEPLFSQQDVTDTDIIIATNKINIAEILPIMVYYNDLEGVKSVSPSPALANCRFGKNGRLFILNYGVRSFTLIHIATYRKNLEMVRYLITRGGDINLCDENGLTPLALCLIYKYGEEFAIELIKLGAKVTGNKGYTNFLFRESLGKTRLLEMVLADEDAKKHINDYDADGFTILHQAISRHSPKAAMIIIKNGADINMPIKKLDKDYNGFSPLYDHGATHDDAIELLRKLQGMTPLDLVQFENVSQNDKELTSLALYMYKNGARHSKCVLEDNRLGIEIFKP